MKQQPPKFGTPPTKMPERPPLKFSGAFGRISPPSVRHGSDTTPTPDPGLTSYPLDDDGTVAALNGNAWIETDAPSYLQGTYTYTGAAGNGSAIATPAAANWLGSQAIVVGAGKILACEAEIVDGPASAIFGVLGMSALASSGGTPAASWSFGAANADGSTPVWTGKVASDEVRAQATALARVGIEINGDTGDVKFQCADGTYTSNTAFTPGQSITFLLAAADDGTTAAAQTCTVRLIPAAADMQLTYTAGAVDVFGDTI